LHRTTFGADINHCRVQTLRLPYISIDSGNISLVTCAKIPFSAMLSPSFVPKPDDWPDQCEVVGTFFTDTSSPVKSVVTSSSTTSPTPTTENDPTTTILQVPITGHRSKPDLKY
jgi:hypothetical protein